MDIYVKLGTHSARMMRLCRRRKAPKVGDVIQLKDLPYERWAKPQGARVLEIRELGHQTLYAVELW